MLSVNKLIMVMSLLKRTYVNGFTIEVSSDDAYMCLGWPLITTLRLRWNGQHFIDDIFECIFFNENVWISIKISLKFVPTGLVNSIPALVQIMAWRQPGDKPLSEPMMVNLLTHICITQPPWVNSLWHSDAPWQNRSGTTFAQVMAYCLKAPIH